MVHGPPAAPSPDGAEAPGLPPWLGGPAGGGGPADTRALLETVHPSLRLPVLRMLEALPETTDLLRSDPVLAAAAAEAVPQELPAMYDALRAVLPAPRGLLSFLDIQPARWMVRLLRRLDSPTIEAGLLRGVLELLRTDDRDLHRMLQHICPMPWWGLETMLNELAPLALTPAVLREAVDLGLDGVHGHLAAHPHLGAGAGSNPFSEAMNTVAWFALEDGRDIPRIRSLGHLVTELERRPGRDQAPWTPDDYDSFPPPPVEGATLWTVPLVSLRPLRTAAELHAHGVGQGNCIPDSRRYPSRAEEGTTVFYEVAWTVAGGPRTATLSVERERDGWAIGQLLEAANAAVPPWLGSAVRGWVADWAEAAAAGGAVQLMLPLKPG